MWLNNVFFYIIFLVFDFCRFCVVIQFFHPRHNGQWPPTSKDFYTRSYPIHYVLILILEKEQKNLLERCRELRFISLNQILWYQHTQITAHLIIYKLIQRTLYNTVCTHYILDLAWVFSLYQFVINMSKTLLMKLVF